MGSIWWSFGGKEKRTESWKSGSRVYPVDLVTQDVDRAHYRLSHNWEYEIAVRVHNPVYEFPHLPYFLYNARSVPGGPGDSPGRPRTLQTVNSAFQFSCPFHSVSCRPATLQTIISKMWLLSWFDHVWALLTFHLDCFGYARHESGTRLNLDLCSHLSRVLGCKTEPDSMVMDVLWC